MVVSPNEIRMTSTEVFEWNFTSKARVKNNQGGTSSTKTYSILQVIFFRLAEKKRIATVIGQDMPNLEKGALRDFQERILPSNPWMWNYIDRYLVSKKKYLFKNGSVLEFVSFKDFQDAKNGKRDIAFFNEANGIGHPIYEQVALRTSEEIYIDYNPSSEFWVHDLIMPQSDCVTFYSNFTHNPYIDASIRDYILSLKDRDMEAWQVYGLGRTGALSETIFKKVTIVDQMPLYLKHRGYGMDFGYTNDPSTLYDCGLLNRTQVYIDEIFYQTGLRTKPLHEKMAAKGVFRSKEIFCDSSEPRLIDDLSEYGWRMVGAKKGDGSVEYGITLLQDYELFITARSENILKEQKKYKYKTDPKTGKILNTPIDAFNHGWDAVRYWAMENLVPLTLRKGVSSGN